MLRSVVVKKLYTRFTLLTVVILARQRTMIAAVVPNDASKTERRSNKNSEGLPFEFPIGYVRLFFI